ncbi:MAG: hypothetical protein AAF926_05280 [Pseudomonadota bacterium]
MTDSDDIIVLTPDDVDDVLEDEHEAAQKRPLWAFVLAGGVVAGFILAFAANWYMRPPTTDLMPLTSQIDSLRADMADLQAQEGPIVPTVNLDPLIQRIDALEARPTVDPLNEEIVTRLEALQADGFEIPEIPDFPDVEALTARIAALESRLDALDSAMQSQAQSLTFNESVIVDPSTLPRFPVDVMRNGAQQLSGSGFFRRTFARHVRMKGSDDPETLIAGIETDLANGRARDALNKFDRLPAQLQSLARGWRADMEDALPG